MSRFKEVGKISQKVQQAAAEEAATWRAAKKDEGLTRLAELAEQNFSAGEGIKETKAKREVLNEERSVLLGKIREIEKEIAEAKNNPELQKQVRELEEARRVYQAELAKAKAEIELLRVEEKKKASEVDTVYQREISLARSADEVGKEASGIMGSQGEGWTKDGFKRIAEEAEEIRNAYRRYFRKGEDMVKRGFWYQVARNFIEEDAHGRKLEKQRVLTNRLKDSKYADSFNFTIEGESLFSKEFPYPNSYFMNVMLDAARASLENPPEYIPAELTKIALERGTVKIEFQPEQKKDKEVPADIIFLTGGKLAGDVMVKPKDDPILNDSLFKEGLSAEELVAAKKEIERQGKDDWGFNEDRLHRVLKMANYNEEAAGALMEEAVATDKERDEKNLAEREKEVSEEEAEIAKKKEELEKELSVLKKIDELISNELKENHLGKIQDYERNIRDYETRLLKSQAELEILREEYKSLPRKMKIKWVGGLLGLNGQALDVRKERQLIEKIEQEEGSIKNLNEYIREDKERNDKTTPLFADFKRKLESFDSDGKWAKAEDVHGEYYPWQLKKRLHELEMEIRSLDTRTRKKDEAASRWRSGKDLNVPLSKIEEVLEERKRARR